LIVDTLAAKTNSVIYLSLKSTFSGQQLCLTIRVCLYSISCCCFPYLRNYAKFWDHTRLSILVSIESAYATSYY